MNIFFFGLLIFTTLLWSNRASDDTGNIIAAISDNGRASHQELAPKVRRIDNYNLDKL